VKPAWEDLREATCAVFEEGEEAVRVLDSAVLAEQGGWASVAFLAEARARSGEWGRPYVELHRYRKLRGLWVLDGRLALKGRAARTLGRALAAWREDLDAEADEDTSK